MIEQATPVRINAQRTTASRSLGAVFLIFVAFICARAIPINEYHRQLQQAVIALDTLAQVNETEDAAAYDARRDQTLGVVRNLLPPNEVVDWNGASYEVDNSWLSPELNKIKTMKGAERAALLRATTERLQAIAERVEQSERANSAQLTSKSEASRKLAEILRRPEYARKVKNESALERLAKQFLKWFQSLFPKPKAFSPGTAGLFSQIAQIFVIVLALAVIGFAAKLFLPRLLRSRGAKKKEKAKARIVLGETLEPDKSAVDLLSEAEALARRGELRAAIRKAYIALLVELGDRKIISLAQHKTNRDYLRALRELQPLYGNVKLLTDSFERHWYGFANATETDWTAFRSAYEQALRR